MEVEHDSGGQNGVLQPYKGLEELPEEIIELLRIRNEPRFLDELATASLRPSLTSRLFEQFEGVFPDTCAKWIGGGNDMRQRNEVIEGFARILPLAPSLRIFLVKYLETTTGSSHVKRETNRIQCLSEDNIGRDFGSALRLQRILLAAFRLLNFDKYIFSQTISGTFIQGLLRHEDRAVRYLAVRVFCQLCSAADFKLEAMIEEHVGKVEPIMGDFDGELRDLGFLSLFEEKRLRDSDVQRNHNKSYSFSRLKELNVVNLSALVVRCSDTLVPRLSGPPSNPSSLIPTATTTRNMEVFAQSLFSPSPILLHGLAGSGKTSLVNDFARELGMDVSMVTIHLNEQTDAKMLIGMYATGSTPGSFTWRAGVLTTAVKEGRWVFIEDFDRAPNEVISVILPLIERGELLIPSRGETIKAGPGFRLLASIRTSLNINGQESPPSLNMLGARLWQRVPVHMPSQDEFRDIIKGMHPILHELIPGIINVYDRLYKLSQQPAFASRSRTFLGRPISPRDLLKWCRRLDGVLVAAGSKSGSEPITETTQYEMFLEATDCFACSLQTEEARRSVISCIAEEMHVDPQRVEHFLIAHIPRYDASETSLTVGRVRLARRLVGRVSKSVRQSRPFANTNHAKRLLEQIGVAVKLSEPVLLVGETGIGKTTVVQQLAETLGFNLVTVNLSQQSEVGDLLGGFKPVNVRSLAIPLKDGFDQLFASTGISVTKNQKYIDQLGKCVAKGQWGKASRLWREAPKMFDKILWELSQKDAARNTPEQPVKRRKTESRLQSLLELKPRWKKFSQDLDQFDVQLSGGSKGFAFTFIEGNIVKAARNGDWVLLDEINLASSDTLESIAGLVYSGPGSTPSILLSETGEIERVKAHPNFRIFGAMNPATDVGKRDLPMGLRSRFTEIYVESPDKGLDDLLAVIKVYLKGTNSNDDRVAHDVARLYLNTKRLADEKRLVDGANQVPHFSLRTLTRVLSYVVEIAPSYGLRRALYEGFAMGFLTLLNHESEKMLVPLINHHLLDGHGNPQALLAQTPRHPEDGKQYVRFLNKKRDRQYWMLQGPEQRQEQPHYIITPFVERNMLNLVRATSTRRFPVLVQGPTSSGKTSMIEYLAKFSGNKFVRINNHEHTDLQEYLGTYISGSDGQLRFQEGVLVKALRQGHWIVLDELNLAPTDVLEALNRLLDDNRELLIPETQEVVRPHENFMLFATQNPPGLYGGRKTLSRAFRNRFLELHFDDIPEDELDFILEKRSQNVAPSDCRRIVSVYKELSRLRQSNRLFEQKDSFATLRDLFRWALRDADNREQLATNGYMLLGERVRNPEERVAVREIIEQVMKVKIDPNVLYDARFSLEIQSYDATSNPQGVVWTHAMRRLYVLVAHALRNNEPVLLVGETGCGKTTVCQMLAEAFGKQLHIVNAHQNTETGDLIGAQRPVRNRAAASDVMQQALFNALVAIGQTPASPDIDILSAKYHSLSQQLLDQIPAEVHESIRNAEVKSKALFEWSDGSLVQAMKDAQFFLLDEISLADDSVLERLNSVLESQRTLLLAEKGAEDSFVQASEGFQFFATMNPGGDYGKRELSPALRNRFTEIWVPSLSEHDDVLQIVQAKIKPEFKAYAKTMVQFAEWFGENYRSSSTTSTSVRDVLAWITFMNGCDALNPHFAVLHGAAMVYIDTLGANPAAMLAINPASIIEERAKCLQQLSTLLQHDVTSIYFKPIVFVNDENRVIMGDFSISKQAASSFDPGFAFEAPTTKLNAMRVMRALQVQKPILLEGSPGVGKTTLIAALARACNRPLTRINLSEQTDLMDLFGSDVPVEGAEAGHFAWRDAPFLQAMQRGEWVLLDEMNLASQSVLEGLNACLDHRGQVYISELDQTFERHPAFSVFAAQNPHHQGGGRKGLPSSFVNRFTVVYADVLRTEDLQLICGYNFPSISYKTVSTIISFVSELESSIVHKRIFGSQGGPWEFNLRDILRWLQLLTSDAPLLSASSPSDFLNLVFRQRFRTAKDRLEFDNLFTRIFGFPVPFRHFFHNLSSSTCQVGLAYLERDALMQRSAFPMVDPFNRLPEIESIILCVQQNLPCILVGPSGCGKTTMLQQIAATSGKSLVVFSLNADIDTMDLVGGFEQVDPQRAASAFLKELKIFLNTSLLQSMPEYVPEEAVSLLELLGSIETISALLFRDLAQLLESLSTNTSVSQFATLAARCRQFSTTPLTLDNARFEWVDGVLVKALEQGSWLVLDNANLCSASVLDRLNSLLEPSGFLSINEHCGPDGEPKIVKPHPEFRIFLTMDPRFGELSRAMRNRAIEIFVNPLQAEDIATQPISDIRPEAALQRYRNVLRVTKANVSGIENHNLESIAIENLAWSDLPLLSRFTTAINGLVPTAVTAPLEVLSQSYTDIYQSATNQNFRTDIRNMLDSFGQANNMPTSFRDAQIFHPLQNSPLVPLILKSSTSHDLFRLGSIFELLTETNAAFKALDVQERGLQALKPSKMNRLQRSLVRGKISIVANDSTVNVSTFLKLSMAALVEFLQTSTQSVLDWKLEKRAIRSMLTFWWRTYQLATSIAFDEAAFQSHISIGTDLLSDLSSKENAIDTILGGLVATFNNQMTSNFDSEFKLKTGLSMGILWKHFRPIIISNCSVVETMAQLEDLARRFDALRWRISIPISELGRIMFNLSKAYRLVLTAEVDGFELARTLREEMDRIEATISIDESSSTPFFTDEFEALRQYQTINYMRSPDKPIVVDSETIIMANYSTASNMRLSSCGENSQTLQSIDFLLGQGESLKPLMDTFAIDLLRKLTHVGDVSFKSLNLLEIELPLVGQKVTSTSSMICRNQLTDLNGVLLFLTNSIITLHTKPVQNNAAHFLEVQSQNFDPVMPSLVEAEIDPKNRIQHSALAWVHFAVGAIKLYVPDRAFDPDKRQHLERQQHVHSLEFLNRKLAALKDFEWLFSRQHSNFRCFLLNEDILKLGDPPNILQKIYRPTISELDQLQGEFRNLLKTIVESKIPVLLQSYFGSPDEVKLQEIRLLQKNVAQIIRRLSDRFRAYNDLTSPAVDLLRCLQIGLSIAIMASESSENYDSGLAMTSIAPYLGGGPLSSDGKIFSAQPMVYLELVATNSSVHKLDTGSMERKLLLKTFHDYYDQWTKQVEANRADAESKSGLYRFRGGANDEDDFDQEQFDELFPSYDNEALSSVGQQQTSNVSARDTAVALALVHEKIFIKNGVPSERILDFIRYISKQIGNSYKDSTSSSQANMTESLLPGALLLLDDQIVALSSTTTVSESYNFYTDSNLPESRKLVVLVLSIQARFTQLQSVDEIGHMQPLADVITSCRELLEFGHTEPLAKVITKVEKVHSFIHEWQFGGWASQANSVLSQYNELTKKIVDWRRLELATWGKLFDMESLKCEDDARSWWFIAYQVVVAAPLQICESPSQLKDYAQKLLRDLESYFSTAVLGQFSQRLKLLKQLQMHLELVMKDIPAMTIIHSGLSNFIALYVGYEKPVQEHLRKGRAILEKDMKDVLLLASWKDTNIVALRDSAKRSHHKLFKIVRKFRALLGQPMDVIITQGLPDETMRDESSDHSQFVQFPTVDLSALTLCAETVPNWSNKSKRFVNVSKTISIMADASKIPESAVEVAIYLDSFLANIITSTAELQKATPSALSEQNKNAVKHLKSRKRKLFADTLKDLRQMGIKHNLSVNSLAKQDSLSIVLANTANLTRVEYAGADYYFNRAMDLIPRAREAIQKHSEDLSGAEVARSSGFLEGLLQVIINQRNELSSSIMVMKSLGASTQMIKCLWSPEAYEIRSGEQVSSHQGLLCWLPNILTVALKLVNTHSKLSNVDSKVIVDAISSWVGTFSHLAQEWNSLAALPPYISSTSQQKLAQAVSDNIQQLRLGISDMIESRPDLAFIVKQVLPWTDIRVLSNAKTPSRSSITNLDEKLSKVCDTILVAIEKQKKIFYDVPTSTEDPSWFAKSDSCYMNAIKVLHPEEVDEKIQQAFDVLRGTDLNDSTNSRTASAIFAVALPILQQYTNILQETVRRYAQLHRATSKTLYILSKTFIQIATQGFCTPSEKSDAQDAQTEKLEGGTGLGDGEGAEDISKDIQDDENLDELAQEPNAGEKGEMEDEQDAVDMADGEMEGDLGEADEQGEDEEGSGDEENDDDMDEEAGDVDDLDPNTVDEKMWDGDGEQAEKDQEGDDSKGKASQDEQVAAKESQKEAESGDEASGDEEDAPGAEQGEELKQDDVEKHDPRAEEGEALDLPDDMELDGDEKNGSLDGSDDGIDDLTDVEDQDSNEELANDGKDEEHAENADAQEDQDVTDDLDVVDADEEQHEDEGGQTEEAGKNQEEDPDEQPLEDQDGLLQDSKDDANADADSAAQSNAQGIGEDQDENSNEENTGPASKAQRDDGSKGGEFSEQNDSAAENGQSSRQRASGEAPQDSNDETQDSATAQPFKRLGDVLEKWHRQQAQIRDPVEQEHDKNKSIEMDAEASEFQHLQDENAEADNQAMGTATEDQARAVDDSMAIDPESTDMPDQFQPDEIEESNIDEDNIMDVDEIQAPKEKAQSDAHEGRAGALIRQANEDREDEMLDSRPSSAEDIEDDVEDVDNQLESTHLDEDTNVELRSASDAREQWTHYEALTRDLSLSLTEQLRLILAPTLATRMRGDFRTGKRLNIKRIIPYIASQYKRDKIWMRRSVPSKRSYQIMLAVDDSKSMGESGSGSLAFETLVMVSKSLSMLEVGEICVVGFGENVKVAHDFDMPFSSDAGPKIFQNFTFEQSRTDVTKLVKESIELFRMARIKASSNPSDLWQMQLIISDGVCNSSEHEPIRRLLREAIEERIMMVFVIVDDLRSKKKGESVMDLKEAKFVKDEMTGASKVKIERYLDTFPFQYYLIVSDVKELPGVLATLLRQWFAEVVDSSR